MKLPAIALGVLSVACAHTAPQHHDGPQIAHATVTPQPVVTQTSQATCPLALPGATLSYAPVSGGGSMLFSISDDAALDELRKRVRAVASYQNRAGYRLAMIDLPHRAEMVPIPGGARIDMVTAAGNDTLELQRSVENHGPSLLDAHCGD